MSYEIDFIPNGWQCPVCRRVYSPGTPMCYYCGDTYVTTTDTLPERDPYIYFDEKTGNWKQRLGYIIREDNGR